MGGTGGHHNHGTICARPEYILSLVTKGGCLSLDNDLP